MAWFEEAEKILSEVRNGRFKFALHATERMSQRGLTAEDIINIARTCYEQKWQEDKATYRFMGHLVDGDKGGFAAVLRSGVVIITVFDRRKGR